MPLPFLSDPAMFGPSLPSNTPALNMFGAESPWAGIATMLAGPMITQRMAELGLEPGQFMGGTNLLNQREDREYWKAQRELDTRLAKIDSDRMAAVVQGVARKAGRRLDPQAVAAFTGGVESVIPFARMFGASPDLVDDMYGGPGSAKILGEAIHRAGQAMYDPTTGKFGLSGAAAYTTASTVADHFGPGADLSGFKGLGMGRVGRMMGEMRARGLMPESIGLAPADEQNRLLTSREGATRAMDVARTQRPDLYKKYEDEGLVGAASRARSADEATRIMNRVAQDIPGIAGDVKTSFDGDKSVQAAKRLTGAVRAMQDIFGDAGHPDAPVPQLFAALDQLTQRGLTSMTPDQLTKAVRTTRVLTQGVEGGIETMIALSARSADVTRALGINQQFAMPMAQGAFAFGQVLGARGVNAQPAWGALDDKGMVALDDHLRGQAFKSPLANAMASTSRILTTMQNAKVTLSPTVLAYKEAVEGGADTFTDPVTGVTRRTAMPDHERKALLVSGGVPETVINQYDRQRPTNEEYTFAHKGIQDLVRREQINDVMPTAAAGYEGSITTNLGVDKGRAAVAAREAALAMVNQTYTGADGTTKTFSRNDKVERSRAGAEVIRESLRRQGVDVDDIERRRPGIFNLASEGGLGDLDSAIRDIPGMAGYTTGLTLFGMHDRKSLDMAADRVKQAVEKGGKQDAVAGVGQQGPLARVVDTLTADSDSFEQFAGKVLGGVPGNTINKGLAAYDKLGKMAAGLKISPDLLRNMSVAGENMEGTVGFGPDEIKEIKALGKDLGAIGRLNNEGNVVPDDNFKKAVRDLSGGKDAVKAEAKADDAPKTMKLSGNVRLENGNLVFDKVTAEPAGHNSTPVGAA